MPNLKDIRNRIASVKSTRQITSAMKMVAAARLRKAQDAIIQLRPYANKLQDILSDLSRSIEVTEENPYAQKREENKILIVAFTSNKGLCGGFNLNVVKTVIQLLHTKYNEQYKKGNVEIYCIGKKGRDLLKFKGYEVHFLETEIFNQLYFKNVTALAKSFMDKFVNKDYDMIELVYNQFKNAAFQILTTEQFLPISDNEPGEEHRIEDIDYIFEPSKQYIYEELIPKFLRIQFYKCILDSSTSEQGARMTAMHKATDNATDLIRDLTLQYNKARQATITREIIEIVSGAEALKF
ncbi:MAG: ATP synthase F1 subunit gamma [Bacteroidales bacterium]|nr:ATP synthase F1 subunit gamma [Bacteroidales bacterium]